jgi:anti-sigma-K factor RskA
MSSSDIHGRSHPDELLAAYSLDTLDHGDTAHVESHLDDCPQCRQSVAEFHSTAAQLAQVAGYQQPDPAVGSRLMEAIARAAVPATPARELPPLAHSAPQMTRLLLPVAAMVVVALFTLAVFMNIRISNRVNTLESENSTLVALVDSVNAENSTLATQLVNTESQASYLADTLHQLQLTSYWLANPANRPLTLKPRGGGGDSRGILLVGENGHQAVLMVSGMEGRARLSIYQIWLLRQGDRLWAGEVEVDDNGWGTATLQPTESVFGFDKVELTAETVAGVAPGPDDMVLEGSIQFTQPYEMLIWRAWR